MKPATEISFTPVDNQRLANLCGVLDENLKQIESALDVNISRRGEHFTIAGSERQTELAARALRRFYEEAAGGLNVEDVQLGLIEESNPRDANVEAEPALITRRRDLHARTPHQVQYLRQIREHDITFGIGPAGTGKTFLAVAHAAMLLERGMIERIVLSRPAVEAGERLGFLPGDVREKVDPYLRPLYDALYDMMPGDKVERAIAAGVIEIAPLAFMRGRTLANAAVILDEAQNTTPMQMKMFLTRLGENARMIVTGDPSQIDLPPNTTSGLVEALRVLDGVAGIVTVRFNEGDVVRHPLVAEIVKAYDRAGGTPSGRPGPAL